MDATAADPDDLVRLHLRGRAVGRRHRRQQRDAAVAGPGCLQRHARGDAVRRLPDAGLLLRPPGAERPAGERSSNRPSGQTRPPRRSDRDVPVPKRGEWGRDGSSHRVHRSRLPVGPVSIHPPSAESRRPVRRIREIRGQHHPAVEVQVWPLTKSVAADSGSRPPRPVPPAGPSAGRGSSPGDDTMQLGRTTIQLLGGRRGWAPAKATAGERPGHGSRPRRPGSDGARRPDRPADLPKAPRDDPEIAALRQRPLMAPASRAPAPDPPDVPVVPADADEAPAWSEQDKSRCEKWRATAAADRLILIIVNLARRLQQNADPPSPLADLRCPLFVPATTTVSCDRDHCRRSELPLMIGRPLVKALGFCITTVAFSLTVPLRLHRLRSDFPCAAAL